MIELGNDLWWATFSDDMKHRYVLGRRVGSRKRVLFILLNPSTATHEQSDPTVTRCVRRARMLGAGIITVCNLFALRSTDPRQLRVDDDPVGPDNDDVILREAQLADLVICGWGEHGRLNGRSNIVRHRLMDRGIALYALGVNGSGEPKHPLYVAYSAQPQPWEPGP